MKIISIIMIAAIIVILLVIAGVLVYFYGWSKGYKDGMDASDKVWLKSFKDLKTVDTCKRCRHNGSYDTDCPINWPKDDNDFCSYFEE